MITITPTAGLCNRMRALDSALALGRAAGVPVRMVWRLNEDLNCPFEELFEPIPGLESFENRREEARPTAKSLAPRKAAKRFPPLVFLVKQGRRLRRSLRRLDPRSPRISEEDTDWCLARPGRLIDLARKRELGIDTYKRFFRGAELFQGFRPSRELRQKIDAYGLAGKKAVGIHVRRGDSKPSWIRSPTEDYIAAMRELCASDPATVFFVASDSVAIEDELEGEFPGRVIRQPNKDYARDDPEGIKHAMIDLFCLASCARFIGSYWSSFSDTAFEIGKMPYVIIDRGT